MNRAVLCSISALFFSCLGLRQVDAQLIVPAATAYVDPDPSGANVSEAGVKGWTDPKQTVTWFGQFKSTGQLTVSLRVKLGAGASSNLKLTVAGQSKEMRVVGRDEASVDVEFGPFEIANTGYQSFRLESQNEPGANAGDLEALILNGPAIKDAHFNIKPRRNAASVHLAYPVEGDVKVSAFYCEMTGIDDPLWTYYMACGWHRGYFGMQVNSPTERRIIFSVWDSGGEAIDRNKVADENRVTLIDKGKDVYSGSFGNEGTGGHSHLKFQWKTGERQRFLVTADPVDATHTIFAGYYLRPDTKKWMLISSWKAPKEGKYMRGLYSFSENFAGKNGHVRRKALYGNQWIRTAEGKWIEITRAKFSHDVTGKADRFDRYMGLEEGQFFLSHGGFIEGFTKYGDPFDREATGRSPADMNLPPLPPTK